MLPGWLSLHPSPRWGGMNVLQRQIAGRDLLIMGGGVNDRGFVGSASQVLRQRD